MKTVNIQVRWAAAQPGQDRRLPSVATHSRLQRATSVRSRVGSSSKTAPGSLSTGSPAGRTPRHGDGSMYSRANVREESVLRPPTRALPSVIVDTEKVLRKAGASVKLVAVRPHTDAKVCSGVRLESRTVRAGEEPEEHKRSSERNTSMTTGMSMDLETCQILGRVSHNLLFWKKNLPTDICGPGGD